MSEGFSLFIAVLFTGMSLALVTLLFGVVFYTAKGFILDDAPFVPTRTAAVSVITRALNLHHNSILYDLGCGDGRILAHAIRSTPGARGIGVDYNLFAYFLATFRTRRLPVQIRRTDILTTPISDATHIYCYLLPDFLIKVEAKLLAQCAPGTRVVSCDFSFPTLIPIETIELPTKKSMTVKKLFIYEL